MKETQSPKQFGEKQVPKVSERRARKYCEEGRIKGAKQFRPGGEWYVPMNAVLKRKWSMERLLAFHATMEKIWKK